MRASYPKVFHVKRDGAMIVAPPPPPEEAMTTTKPKWVQCLERAEAELELTTDLNAVDRARVWITIASIYREGRR